MDDGRNHRHVRASADPDSDAFGFDLDAPGIATASPDIRLGLASRCLALIANSHGRYHGVYHCRYKRRIGSHQRRHRRACRRQVNTCCGVSPCRRAISETTAPGTSVSSTIRALSSLENQRRRPVSVITSSRCAVTSDLSVWSSIDTSRSLQRDRETHLSHVPREGGAERRLRLNDVDPKAWLAEVLARIADLPASRLHELHALGMEAPAPGR
ncbi:hypothetical protein ACVIHF_000584 [Bradyrhizobium sp. USDA 4506]